MDFTPTPSMSASSASRNQSRVVAFCDKVIQWTLLALAALVPIFFLPFSLEVLELNKQLLLVVGAGIAGLAWVGKMLAERRFEYRKSVVNVIVLLYLGVYALSALFSKNVYMSLAGDFGQQMSGLTTIAAFVALYFVVINNIRTAGRMHELFLAIIIGGFLSGLYGLLQGIGLFVLPFGFAQAPSFNSVGTVGTLAVYQAFIVTLIGGMFLRHDWKSEGKSKLGRGLHMTQTVFMAITAVIGLFIISVVDFWPVTVSLLIASLLLIGFAFFHAKALKSMGGVLLPIGALIISLMLLVFRFPVSLGYPAEVMPSMKASTNITLQSLREKPFFGSGPGTFLYDYAKHRSADVNSTAFWNIRFDRASSQFMTMLATTGLLGALSWLAVALFLLWSAVTTLLKSEEQAWHLLIGMLATWFLLVLSKFLYSSTLTLEFATWLIMALLVVVHRKEFFQVKFDNSPRAAMTLSFIFILGIVFSISGLFVMVQRYAAESRYADAIRMDQVGGDVDQVIDNLAKATRLNTANDVYVRNLGLALLAKANREAALPLNLTKGEDEPDEAFEARVQAAQADKLRRVATLASNAVNISRQASEMNPNNVANWSVLASIYQNLFGVSDGADVWAAKSYEEAIKLEPANPSLHNELGKVYLYQADLKAQAASNADGEDKAELEKGRDDLYAKAADSFQAALDNKADFAPAHFFLGVAMDRQGKLKEAIQKMEDVLAFSPRDVGVGFQLALLYYRDDRKDDAINLMLGVVRLSPQYSNARWYLASMLEEKGELDAAIAQLEVVQSLNEGNEAVDAKVAELKAKLDGGAPEEPAVPEAPAEGEGLPAPVEVPVENPNAPSVTP